MKVLVTGGLGFIGCNTAASFARDGHEVVVWDTKYRVGTSLNQRWLESVADVQYEYVDITRGGMVYGKMHNQGYEVIIHEAAQTAVTTSVDDPDYDFQANVVGTYNVLRTAQRQDPQPIFIYASTNKVYGALTHYPVVEEQSRWEFEDQTLRRCGMSESAALDPISPYGCSKLAGEHYVRDFCRMYGIPTVSFRQSCIYGPRQLGGTDQGWLAWFVLAQCVGYPLTIFGDGKQVRDMLYVDDLVDAYKLAIEHIGITRGQVYNIGGGVANSVSIWRELSRMMGWREEPKFEGWRPGDQKIHTTDNGKFHAATGWAPSTPIRQGIDEVKVWTLQNLEALQHLHDNTGEMAAD